MCRAKKRNGGPECPSTTEESKNWTEILINLVVAVVGPSFRWTKDVLVGGLGICFLTTWFFHGVYKAMLFAVMVWLFLILALEALTSE